MTPNKISITTLPIVVSEHQKKRSNYRFLYDLAKDNLNSAQNAIKKALEDDIPILFGEEIILTISTSLNSRIKIDYSAVKRQSTVRLIKAYLSKDPARFETEWAKIL